MKHRVPSSLAVMLLLLSLGAVAPGPAVGQEAVTGAFQCNAEKIPIRGAVARWEPDKKALAVMFFKSPPSAETVKHWAAQPSEGARMIPEGMDYFASITFKMKSDAAKAGQDAIQSYHFYINCPTLQMNLNRSVFTGRNMSQDFPAFAATLQRGGRLRVTLKGSETMGMSTPVKATWDARVDTAVHVK